MLIITALLSVASAEDPHQQDAASQETEPSHEETLTPASPDDGVGIINGADATEDDYPMTGGILITGVINLLGSTGPIDSFVCSSTLIAPDVVLTAAHCIDDTALTFGLGSVEDKVLYWSRQADLTDWDGSTQGPDLPEDAIEVIEAVMHPSFSLDTLQLGLAVNDDIGLLFLSEPVTDVPHAYLPTAEEAAQIEEGIDVDVVGWGLQEPGGGFFEPNAPGSFAVKQMGTSFISEVADAEFKVGEVVTDVRKCNGDSGGPTFMVVDTDSSEKVRLIGVTSHSYDESQCEQTGGVDTRVDYFLDWINDEMVKGCESGVRVSCDVEGILPPPASSAVADRDVEGEGRGGIAQGCSAAPAAPGALVALLAGLLGLARRRD
ncbi:MAG: trypsin-like serine protease [Myxococcota bacterium]